MKNDHKHKFATIILAAGAGTRMRSKLPKVMHKLACQPMIVHVLDSVAPLAPEKTVVVVAPHMDVVKATVQKHTPSAAMAVQEKQLGTGNAVASALGALKGYEGTVLVLYGDTPMITTNTINTLLSQHAQHKVAISLLGMRPNPPTGYGRLVMKQPPYVERIVECKDANAEEKNIADVWAGVMAFDAAFLQDALPKLKPSPVTGEYYLTTLIEMAAAQNLRTLMVPVDVAEAMGVNSRMQLAEAEAALQARLRLRAMEQGATLVDPSSVHLCTDTRLGQDVVIHPNVFFGPGVSVADNVEIRSFCHLEGAAVDEGAIIGPYARLRPGTRVGQDAHVGNFVELKQTQLGKGAKANHLSYIGDAEVGEAANVGAGTITCNYDGVANKYKTVIGAGASIGSNTSLVAPVSVGKGAIVGAGSVITEDVADDALSLARAAQVNMPGKGAQFRQKRKKA